MRAAVDAGLLVKGGGHAMAAGVTLEKGRLGEWRAFLEERLAEPVARARAGSSLAVDAAMMAAAATPDLARKLEAAGPYGSGNPEPMFVLPRHRLVEVMPVGADHLRVRAAAGDGSTVEAIAFRSVGKKLGDALVRLKGAPAISPGRFRSTATAAASGRSSGWSTWRRRGGKGLRGRSTARRI